MLYKIGGKMQKKIIEQKRQTNVRLHPSIYRWLRKVACGRGDESYMRIGISTEINLILKSAYNKDPKNRKKQL